MKITPKIELKGIILREGVSDLIVERRRGGGPARYYFINKNKPDVTIARVSKNVVAWYNLKLSNKQPPFINVDHFEFPNKSNA